MEALAQETASARYGNPHAQPGVVRIDRAQAANLLHVIASAPDCDFSVEERAQRLEPAHALIAELLEKGCTVQVKPDGLHVDHNAQSPGFGYALWRHEIAVCQTRPRCSDRCFLIHGLVHVEQ